MKKWTIEEVEILKDNYATLLREDLCQTLPDRTWVAIRLKAQTLKLCKYKGTGIPEERFWHYVDKKMDHECWNWTGARLKGGYGQIGINNKIIQVHRFSWELHFGEIPKNLCVLHKCNNPSCVNPNHLYLGTNKDNSEYMVECNRQAKGENNGRSKLTESQVKEIRNLKGQLSIRKIAKIFNVDNTTISEIHRNQIWKHIN